MSVERKPLTDFRFAYYGNGGHVHLSQPYPTLDALLAELQQEKESRARYGLKPYTHVVTFLPLE